MKDILGGVCAPIGFSANGIHAGMRKNKSKKDLSLIVSEELCTAAATYTQNKVKGAPLTVTKQHLKNGRARAIICNSGNANTCNSNGIELANEVCALAAKELGLKEDDIIVASTGVIGQPMSIDPFKDHMKELVKGLNVDGSHDACYGIMTTDTQPKEYAVEFKLGNAKCHIGAIAKGSGMIHPNMATMLSFVVTDANIEKELLQKAFKEIVNDSYNMISVDGDTSTNDMACVIANGLAGNKKISEENEDYNKFKMALQEVNEALAKKIAEDGEGATKFLEVEVLGAKSKEDARLISKSVITSNLTKCAFFGADANWGRILCAMGYSGGFFEVDKVKIELQAKGMNLVVAEAGRGIGFDEEYAKQLLLHKFLKVVITLEDGNFTAKAWGCDLSYDYVKINGDYRS